MEEKELKFILQEGEGYKIEFKESFDPKNLSKEFVAFANSEGGKIILGVKDQSG
jgi:ATP-dependent DNA helicase RecG